MRILRQKAFSSFGFSKKIGDRLEKDKVDDYEISNRIPKDSISLNADPAHLEIYIPSDFEYCQYEIDDFIRDMIPFIRTETEEERDLFVMTTSKPLTEEQYYKLIKFIITEYEFCVIVDR